MSYAQLFSAHRAIKTANSLESLESIASTLDRVDTVIRDLEAQLAAARQRQAAEHTAMRQTLSAL